MPELGRQIEQMIGQRMSELKVALKAWCQNQGNKTDGPENIQYHFRKEILFLCSEFQLIRRIR